MHAFVHSCVFSMCAVVRAAQYVQTSSKNGGKQLCPRVKLFLSEQGGSLPDGGMFREPVFF